MSIDSTSDLPFEWSNEMPPEWWTELRIEVPTKVPTELPIELPSPEYSAGLGFELGCDRVGEYGADAY